MRYFLVFSLAIMTGGLAQSPDRKPFLDLDLRSAVQLALAQNFDIQIAEFTPKIAQARQLSASGRFDPVLQFSYTYDENRQQLRTLNDQLLVGEVDGATPDIFALRQGNEVDSALAGLLPWGLTYDLGASVNWDNDSQRNPGFTRYNSFTGLSVVQPLLRNFGFDVNLAQIRIARADRAISQWQLRGRIIDIVTTTILVYNDLYFAQGNLEVELKSRELARQTLQDNIKRTDIGVMSPLDVVQAQADLASREERVLVAERAVADNENFLKQLVTNEVSQILEVGIRIAPPPLQLQAKPDRAKDFPRAFELRPDYRQALVELQKRNINLIFTRNQALPRLDLLASFGVNGVSTELADALARSSFQDSGNTAWSLGAIFSVPIPNRDARGQLEVSKLEIARALVELKRLEQQILVDMDNAAGQIETTRKRIDASRAARVFAERTLEAAQTRLASGTTTTFEVLQFQRDLSTARINEIRALTDHSKALAEYARQTGITIERAGIVLE